MPPGSVPAFFVGPVRAAAKDVVKSVVGADHEAVQNLMLDRVDDPFYVSLQIGLHRRNTFDRRADGVEHFID